ncbi:hypothetical protein FK216_11925 [Moraxellaceae bacterium AER2_44_116]|nr:hypothetical protein FK216_11925 [Moraxellaceae bacterium AER2_44_116]
MLPHEIITYAKMNERAQNLKAFFKVINIIINPSSTLARYIKELESTQTLQITYPTRDSFPLDARIRIAHACYVVSAIDRVRERYQLTKELNGGVKELLRRIAKNQMDLNDSGLSKAKNALWELEVFRYFQDRDLEVRFDEPDIIVDLSVVNPAFGDYAVACKNITSIENVENQLSSACEQLANKFGIAAFNFTNYLAESSPRNLSSHFEGVDYLSSNLKVLISRFEKLFCKKLEDGRLDGLMLSATAFFSVDGASTEMDSITHTCFFFRPNIQPEPAKERFRMFSMLMEGQNVFAH